MEMLLKFTHLSHTIIGTIAFAGGLMALLAHKGGRYHRIGGQVFVYGMLYASVSVAVLMFEEFLPLAIVMSLATVYYLVTAVIAAKTARRPPLFIHYALMAIPALLAAFALFQFLRIMPEVSLGSFGRLLLASVLALAVKEDVYMIRERSPGYLFYIRRHASHMVMAMAFAVMAVLRVGIKFDFFGLAFTTVAPLALGLLAMWYVRANISRFVKVKKPDFVPEL